MYIVAIAWMFVVVLMAAAEAMTGAILGALGTLLLYGALPLGIVLYLLTTPARRRARKEAEAMLTPVPPTGLVAPPGLAPEDALPDERGPADDAPPADRNEAEPRPARAGG